MRANAKKKLADIERTEEERAIRARQGFQITLNVSEKVLLQTAAEKQGKALAVYIREAAIRAAGGMPEP